MASRFGSVIANVMSIGARALGYIIYGVLLMIYRRDPRMIALFGGVFALIGLGIWLLLR
ncbi:hypothetical protein P6144_01725 [Sphingomonas sp. HITSZ_GF]|uniref:hypothetical protein n=1 Tax=Sphingomonas sp. HITSZ_GF TaxID=3037247 RepID=UPI00240D5200|nr:hypothetical protein [Sphingomonas sp. HITSZ_GF]MDG2532352.1 hypothetical protein [Sphingomonas sp. HITSZ_GF]